MSTVTCTFCNHDYPDRLETCPACGMAPTAPARALPKGTELQEGKLTIGRVLGEGGFGITYKGAHTPLQRAVAIKEMFPEGALRLGSRISVSAGQQEAFHQERESILQEARLIARLNSPHIVDVYDIFLENGTAYIVMEYLEGQTLQERIDAEGPLPLPDVQQMALDICAALTEIHRQGLLHRDLKPANIIRMTQDQRTVLIDFGSAREFTASQTARHTRILTEDYAAPEQFSGQARFGPYTDIFCLGATLFHALAGTPPPRALERLQSDNPAVQLPASVQGPLGNTVQWALQLKVQDRPQTVADFQRILTGSGTHGARQSTPAAIPVADSVAPSTQEIQEVFSPTHHPYVFKNAPYHSSQELAGALVNDWDEAISDWKKGYIRRWLTHGVTGSRIERDIDEMLKDPFYAVPPIPTESLEEVALERQLLRLLALLDPNLPLAYRGMPLQDEQAISDWIRNASAQQDYPVLDRCLRHAILVAHPEEFGRRLHEKLQQEMQIYRQHLRTRLAPKDREEWNPSQINKDRRWIFTLIVGADTAEEVCLQMQEDRKAMKIRWFRNLVDEASQSPGCAAILPYLQPIARRKRNRNIMIFVGVGLFVFWVFIFPGLTGP